MADMPSQGTPMDPSGHPATSIPNATQHHAGTELSTEAFSQVAKSYKRPGFSDSDLKDALDQIASPKGIGVEKY